MLTPFSGCFKVQAVGYQKKAGAQDRVGTNWESTKAPPFFFMLLVSSIVMANLAHNAQAIELTTLTR
jgi:hypothetical protein